jgi:hypothetical protein
LAKPNLSFVERLFNAKKKGGERNERKRKTRVAKIWFYSQKSLKLRGAIEKSEKNLLS